MTTPVALSLRIVGLIATVLLVVPTILVSTSYAVTATVPQTAVAIWPANGEALSRAAQAKLLEDEIDGVREMATRALVYEPVTPQAIRTISLVGEIEGSLPARMAALIDLSERFSRRDLLTNLRLIERRVAQGDVRGALVYYDRALRTDGASEKLLFPTLVSAANEPPIAAALSDLLVKYPSWQTGFLQYAFASSKADKALVPIAIRLSRQPQGLREDLKRYYIQRLADVGKWPEAFTLYRAWSPSPAAVGASLAAVGAYPPLDWKLASRFEASATPTAQGGFTIDARSGQARVAERILNLSPGNYAFAINSQFDNAERAIPVTVSLGCQGSDAAPLLKRPVGAGEAPQLPFTVPASGCTAQSLAFDLGEGDVGTDVPMRLTVTRLAITKN
ncbi:MAG: hypothetical protein C0500_12195 [Sphingobium sp.]|nr:hypothetical protein [Sphingobium sp.]